MSPIRVRQVVLSLPQDRGLEHRQLTPRHRMPPAQLMLPLASGSKHSNGYGFQHSAVLGRPVRAQNICGKHFLPSAVPW